MCFKHVNIYSPNDQEQIATEATNKLMEIYHEYGWKHDVPKISNGMVKVILEVAVALEAMREDYR